MEPKVNMSFVVFFAFCCLILNGVHSFPNDVVHEVRNKAVSRKSFDFTQKINENLHNLFYRQDGDCQPAAFEKLDLPELVKKVEINERCLPVATEVFQKKYADKLISVFGPKFDANSNTTVNIRNLNVASKTLEYFGHKILKLKITLENSIPCDSFDTKEINKFLSHVSNGRDSLISFELSYASCAMDIFNAIKGPYTKAEHVVISVQRTELKTGNIRLNEVFPKVLNLTLAFDEVSDVTFVDYQFRHLKMLTVGGWASQDFASKSFEGLLEKNAEITAFGIITPTRKALEVISKHSHSLKQLTIVDDLLEEFNYDKINFENVEILEIVDNYDCHSLEKISFKKLKELTFTNSSSVHNDVCFDFIFTYENIIDKFTMRPLNDEQLLKLIRNYTQLSEANFEFKVDVSAESLVKFVQKSPMLNKLTFSRPGNLGEFLKKLAEELGGDFNIVPLNSEMINHYSIERKVPVGNGSAPSTFAAHNAVIISIAMIITRTFLY